MKAKRFVSIALAVMLVCSFVFSFAMNTSVSAADSFRQDFQEEPEGAIANVKSGDYWVKPDAAGNATPLTENNRDSGVGIEDGIWQYQIEKEGGNQFVTMSAQAENSKAPMLRYYANFDPKLKQSFVHEFSVKLNTVSGSSNLEISMGPGSYKSTVLKIDGGTLKANDGEGKVFNNVSSLSNVTVNNENVKLTMQTWYDIRIAVEYSSALPTYTISYKPSAAKDYIVTDQTFHFGELYNVAGNPKLDYSALTMDMTQFAFRPYAATRESVSLDNIRTYVPDETVFEVANITPEDQAKDVPVDTSITIKFSKEIKPSSFDTTSLKLIEGGNVITYNTKFTADTCTITPSAVLKNNTLYNLEINGIESASGEKLTGFISRFTTVSSGTQSKEPFFKQDFQKELQGNVVVDNNAYWANDAVKADPTAYRYLIVKEGTNQYLTFGSYGIGATAQMRYNMKYADTKVSHIQEFSLKYDQNGQSADAQVSVAPSGRNYLYNSIVLKIASGGLISAQNGGKANSATVLIMDGDSQLKLANEWYDFRLEFNYDKQVPEYTLWFKKSTEANFKTAGTFKLAETTADGAATINYASEKGFAATTFQLQRYGAKNDKLSSLSLDNLKAYYPADFGVESIVPADKSVNVPVNTTIKVKFNRGIKEDSFSNSTVKLKKGIQEIVYTATADADTYIITPDADLENNTSYTVEIDGVKSSEGEVLAESFAATFKTIESMETQSLLERELSELPLANGALLGNIELPSAKYGATLSFASGDKEYLTDDGVLLKYPTDADRVVSFTVTASLDGETEAREITYTIPRALSNQADPNSGFETGDKTNWVEKSTSPVVSDRSKVFQGKYAAEVIAPDQTYRANFKEVRVTPSTDSEKHYYMISFWAKLAPSNATDTAKMQMYDNLNGMNLNADQEINKNTWTKVVSKLHTFDETWLEKKGNQLTSDGKIVVSVAPNFKGDFYYDNVEVVELITENATRITSVSPTDGEEAVDRVEVIALTFNNCIDADSVTASTVKITDGMNELPFTVVKDAKSVVLKLNTPIEESGNYMLTVSGARDIYGGAVEDFTSSFSIPKGPLAPVAKDVKIEGKMTTGSLLTGSYRFFDVDKDTEQGSTYRWLSADSADAAESAWQVIGTERTYVLKQSDEEKYIKFEVTPKTAADQFPNGEPTQSSALLGPAKPVAKDVVITSGAIAGRTITGDYTFEDRNGDKEGTTLFQWYRADSENAVPVKIDGATGGTYLVTSQDRYLIFEVTPVSTENPTDGIPVRSQRIPVKSENGAPAAINVRIEGETTLGSILEGKYEYSDPDGDPEGESVYKWYTGDAEDGDFEEIPSQNTKTLEIVKEYAGKYIRFEVTPKDAFDGVGTAVKSGNAPRVESAGTGELHVALNGDDNNDGSLSSPFASLEKARDTIRALKAENKLPLEGMTVYIHEGVYHRNQTFTLNEQDSGTKEAPIVYKAFEDDTVNISGGAELDYNKFKPISSDMAEKLRKIKIAGEDKTPYDHRDKIKVADLSDLGITDFPGITIFKDNPSMPMFLYDGKALQVSRYPNNMEEKSTWLDVLCSSYKQPNKVPGTNPGWDERHDDGIKNAPFTIHVDDSAAETWTHNLNDIVMYGYWSYDWYGEARKVADWNHSQEPKGLFVTSDRHNYYGVITDDGNRKFYFMNVFEEIDQPGDWYIDMTEKKMYLYPLDDSSNPEIKMTKLDADMVSMNDVSNVTFSGIEISAGRKNGVVINGGSNVRIENCELDVFEQQGVVINSGTGHGVLDSHIHQTGTGGVTLSGGDIQKIKESDRAGNFVENCEINDFALVKKSYSPAVEINGVGNIVRNCKLYNAPHAALIFHGTDNIMEYNEIFNAVLDATDMGSIYTGRDLSSLGNIIRYNYFHDLGKNTSGAGGGWGVQSIFLDDGASGTDIYGNVFGPYSGSNYSIKTHGGHDVSITNNIFVDTPYIYYMADWSDDDWSKTTGGVAGYWRVDDWGNKVQETMRSVSSNPDYLARWPWLGFCTDINTTKFQGNTFENNIMAFINVKKGTGKDNSYIEKRYHEITGLKNNLLIEGDTLENKAIFVDYENADYTLRSGSFVFDNMPDFVQIPFDKIGLQDKTPVLSSNAKLLGIMVDGEALEKFSPDTYQYKMMLPAKTTDVPTVTATPYNANATVTITPAEGLPGDTKISVASQDGKNTLEYTVSFTVKSSPTPTPTTPVNPPINNGGGGNADIGGGNVTSSGSSGLLAQGKGKTFVDTVGHWAESDIKYMTDKGIISGVTDTTFEPERPVTRAEFATLVVKALNITSTVGLSDWKDVPSDAWYASSVVTAANAGIIVGFEGYFRPDDIITREEMAVIIAKAYAYAGGTAHSLGTVERFTDKDDISDWAYSYVDTAASVGLIYGVTNETFEAQSTATRAQVAALVRRLYDKINN